MLEAGELGLVAAKSRRQGLKLKRILGRTRLEVEFATDKKQALAMLRKNIFALAVIELELLGSRPESFMAKIRAEGIQTAILIQAPESQVKKSLAVVAAGADDYLLSPFTVSAAEFIIQRLLLLRKHGLSAVRHASPAREPASLAQMIRKRLKPFFEQIDTSTPADWHEKLMAEFERQVIGLALEKYHGNRTQAAKLLGINRNTITKHMHRLGIK